MKLYNTLFIKAMFSTVILSSIGCPPLAVADQGVDDLRGRWDIDVGGLGAASGRYQVFINDLQPDPGADDAYLAAGCMQSPASGVLAPLSLRAQQTSKRTWEVSFLSTVVPQDNPPFVIRFLGPIYTLKRGVSDDVAGGQGAYAQTEFTNDATWQGIHHDRRRKKCPAVEIPPFSFRADVYASHSFMLPGQETVKTLLEGVTDIVSSGMLVERPDGTTTIIPSYTDIFSPDVDFINQFRYLCPYNQCDDGDPIAGQPYIFTLLDAFGNPIPGTTQTDLWTMCVVEPPKNLSAVTVGADINLSWEYNGLILGNDGFDPANGIGFYQIAIDAVPYAGPSVYGSNLIKSLNHVIPWNDFTPPSPGTPDGFDLGVGLNRFGNGVYSIRLDAFGVPPSYSVGRGLECWSGDFSENLLFEKTDSSISFP